MIGLILVLAGYAGCFTIGEVLHRRGLASWMTRKIVHVLGGAVTVCLPFVVSWWTAVSIGGAATVFLAVAYRRRLLPSVFAEHQSTLGPIFFPLGLTLAAVFFWRHDPALFQAGTLVLALSDGAAAWLGKLIGRHSYTIVGRKTIEGSLAFLVVTVGVLLVFTPRPEVIFAALGLTFLEAISARGFDNLLLPSATALLLSLLR